MQGSHDATMPRSPTVLAAALLLLATPLAGCIGSEGTPDPDTLSTDSTSPSEVPAPQAALSFDAEATETVRWANGSFASHEILVGENGPSEKAERKDEHKVDVTEMLPKGVPVHLKATISYDGTSRAHLETFLYTGGEPIYRFDTEKADGEQRMKVTMARTEDGPVKVVADADKPSLDSETPYTLQIKVKPLVDHVPSDAPIAVDVPAAAERLTVRPADANASATARVWGPEDTHLARNTGGNGTAVELPVAGEGEHVLMVDEPSYVRLLDAEGQPVAPPSPIRPLAWAFEFGDKRALDPAAQGPQTFGFELKRTPVSVGFALKEAEPAGVPARNASIELVGPDGTGLATHVSCSMECQLHKASPKADFHWAQLVPLDEANPKPGSYELVVDADPHARMKIAPAWLTFER